ncbi:hypothetical protein EDB83DRAFT_2318490 [Lactarius deliciosus]|nr:hypothetical protein EDB83DRAFT_2318490 [Lactarius deliciosus]
MGIGGAEVDHMSQWATSAVTYFNGRKQGRKTTCLGAGRVDAIPVQCSLEAMDTKALLAQTLLIKHNEWSPCHDAKPFAPVHRLSSSSRLVRFPFKLEEAAVIGSRAADNWAVPTFMWAAFTIDTQSFNTIGQNSCSVAAYLLGTCDGGEFTLYPILNSSFSYLGPPEDQGANLCFCNTVTYNLLSACSVCQGAGLRTWSDYSHNCTKTMDPSTFPNPIPPDTRVPQWALRDVTLVNLWDATTAFNIGGRPLFLYGFRLTERLSSDTPEILPGSLIGTSSSSSVSPTSSTSSSAPTPTSPVSTSSGGGSNAGAIAGGVAGGVVALAAIAGLLFVFRRRQQRAQAPSAAFLGNEISPPPSASSMSKVPPASSYGHTQGSRMTLYDPDNPSTYPLLPEHVPTSTLNVNVPAVGSYNGYSSGNNPINLQPLRPQGYHGLPTV